MKNNRILTIIKQITGQGSSADARDLQLWEEESPQNKAVSEEIRKTWEWSGHYEKEFTPDVDAGLSRLKARIAQDKAANNKTHRPKAIAKSRSMWPRMIRNVAAVAAIVLGFAFLAKNYLTPSAKTFIVNTTEGQQEQIELTDGSVVYLNENSSLSFNAPHNKSERRATLTGEAFFEVAKNPNKPFIIETNDTKVEVLGTSFNVRAIAEENFTEVLVKTGKVSFQTKETQKEVLLVANEKGLFQHQSKALTKEEDQTLNSLAWHSKTLQFQNTPLKKVLGDLERYYDVNIELTETEMYNCGFTSPFTDANLNIVLETLRTAFGMELEKVNKRNYRLKGGSCQ